MGKINRTIVAIKTVLEKNGVIPHNSERTSKSTTHYLLRLFSTVEDARVPGMIKYPLSYILLCSFLAVLGGANNWIEIHDFCESKQEWLGKFLNVKKLGIPSHDTFCRVFAMMNPTSFEETITSILEENIKRIKNSLNIVSETDAPRLICIDGKEENGTGRKYCAKTGGKVRNIQTLHVYDFTNQICLASEPIEEKTNEIPTAQKILKTIDLRNTVCTCDALHMQCLTVSIIRNNKGHYVIGLKGNQKGLMETASSCFSESVIQKLKKSKKKNKPVYITDVGHAHGQKENREYFLAPIPDDEELRNKWDGLRSFVMCVKTLEPDSPKLHSSTEVRYYATDLDDLSLIADAIRSHWSIEQFHWQLDVSFQQDNNSTMNVKAYENLTRMNKMCLHLFQLMKTVNKGTSVLRMRKRFGWNFEDSMEELLTYFDEKAIIQVLNSKTVNPTIS